MKTSIVAGLIALAAAAPHALVGATPAVVINEIMYHPPKGWDDVQWIEVHNHGTVAVDLSDWKLTGGIEHSFPKGTTLPPNGFHVVAAHGAAFEKAYRSKAHGTFSQRLEKDNSSIVLANPSGEPIDRVKYKDNERWPEAADGGSSSLERIYAPGSSKAGNWAASLPTEDRKSPGGTPGKQNNRQSDKPVPEFRRVSVSSEVVKPGEKFQYSAEVKAEGGVTSVTARIQTLGSGAPTETTAVLKPDATGRISAEMTASPAPGLHRIRFEAVGSNGTRRFFPDPADAHPAVTVLVRPDDPRGKLDLAYAFLGSETGDSRGGRNGEPSQESQMVWRAQQRIQQEANPYTLVAGLVITNDIVPGQLAKLRPILKTVFEKRNELVRTMYDADDVLAATRNVPSSIARWKKEVESALRPVLSPEQESQLNAWMKAAPQNRRGVDPSYLLSMWLNIEQTAYYTVANTGFDEATWARARKVIQNGISERIKLQEPAKTAFESNESREKFQAQVTGQQEKLHAALESVISAAEWQSAQSVQDGTQFYRELKNRSRKKETEKIPGAFVHVKADTGETVLFDHAEVLPRKAGWKIHLAPGDHYHGMSAFNLIYEENDRFVIAEPLAFDLYRRAGNAAPATEFLRLTLNGEPQGYHLLVEQPNRRFLSRNGLDPDGVLYKIGWQGNTLEELHERKSPGTGHGDLKELVRRLEAGSPAEQWKNMREQLNVPQVITYFAVNSVLGHWDGYMNNYFIYHDSNGTGRWTMYPWDQDKTFGFHDGLRADEPFTDMPFNFGARGDRPPNWKGAAPKSFFEVYQRNGPQWWRQPGPISGPCIANPEFRKHYAARIRNLLDGEFSVAKMDVIFAGLSAQLREEASNRGRVKGEDPKGAMTTLESNIQSLKRFVKGRREYLLAQDEIKNAGPWKPDELNLAK